MIPDTIVALSRQDVVAITREYRRLGNALGMDRGEMADRFPALFRLLDELELEHNKGVSQ